MLKYTTCYRDLSYLGIPIIIGQIGTIVMSFIWGTERSVYESVG